MTNTLLVVLPYSAISFSIVARIIFMYLLYTKKSTNIYSLSFCYISILSSSLWIPYTILQEEPPMLIRSCVEIGLLSISAGYITYNRFLPQLQNEQITLASTHSDVPVKVP
jgi:hypothetical protein